MAIALVLVGSALLAQTSRPAAAQSMPKEDPPLASRPANGKLSGVIAPAEKLGSLVATDRATGRTFKPDMLDAKTGAFAFNSLPGDTAYDLCLALANGRRIEGIDLSWFEAPLARLAELRRAQLGMEPAEQHVFGRRDVDELLAYVRELKDFTNLRRVLYVRGDGGRAAMLVEAMRTTDFYAQKDDQLIWRMELWYFQYQYGGWERVPNVERVLQRQRIPEAKWKGITLVYEPTLSVYIDPSGQSRPVNYAIPEKLDPARGRLADTEPEQKTQPTIIGLEDAATSRRTQ